MNKSTLISLALLSALSASAQRTTQNLRHWQFSRDSISYKAVTIPHDWAINGPFDKKWDLQNVAIVQNGETEKTEKSGRSGALPWIGRGYYKTTVDIKRVPKTAVLEFDAMMGTYSRWGSYNQDDSSTKTLLESIAAEYQAYGYTLPRLIFWNVCSRTNTIMLQENEAGVALVSGFNPAVYNMVLSNELDPYKCLLKQINSERYDAIENILCA